MYVVCTRYVIFMKGGTHAEHKQDKKVTDCQNDIFFLRFANIYFINPFRIKNVN